tara:strand:+ start:4050 stop:4472 length:423 start_codon:yes stop_codon:yes gene_type:complete
MDNKQEQSDFEGARDKCIYAIRTFVNQDGFKVEKHKPVDDKGAPSNYYGFYLINTEMGPIDRYFKFHKESNIDDCFDNFRPLAEEDAKALAAEMKEQHELAQQQEAVENQAVDQPPPSDALSGPPDPDTHLLDEDGSPVS